MASCTVIEMDKNTLIPNVSEFSRCTCNCLFMLLFHTDRTAAHKDVCFLQVDEGLICSEPRNGLVVTYSECCCHYGRGWGPECNTCPPRNSGELRTLSDQSNLQLLLCFDLKRRLFPCVQRCSVDCVRCIWRLSLMGSRISWQLLPTTTLVKASSVMYTHVRQND